MTNMLMGRSAAVVLGMMWIMLIPPCLQAYGPMTEYEKKESRFFDCIRSMEEANTDGDHTLTKEEFPVFVTKLAYIMFEDDSILELDEELPKEVLQLFPKLIVESEAESGAKAINVYGASLMGLATVNEHRLKTLHKVCETVMKGKLQAPPTVSLAIHCASMGFILCFLDTLY